MAQSNCTIVILGATGDLSRRKIIPAIYRLVRDDFIGNFSLIGAAFTPSTDEDFLIDAKSFIPDFEPMVWKKCCEHSKYCKIDFTAKDDYQRLKEMVLTQEKEKGLPGNRLFYCATAATFFEEITKGLARVGLIKKGLDGSGTNAVWQRVVYEKPFGQDLASAQDINRAISEYLTETQIYRIDHYLAKELVGNIALVRFTNRVFEPMWNNIDIDNVQIVLSEEIGVLDRGRYYDKFGALKDVVQNHMLQLLALVAMESPKKLTGTYIQQEKARVLKDVHFKDGILGQYRGYPDEKYIEPDSNTDTFAALAFSIDNKRWRGVPFFLKTGKKLDKKATIIVIRFKKVECLLAETCPSEPNYIIIRVTPNEGFALELNVKKPGVRDEVMPVTMDYCHSCLFGPKLLDAYEVLIDQVIKGDQSVSVGFKEIEYSWEITDTIEQAHLPVYKYEPDSTGPEEIKGFEEKNNMKWKV